MNGAIARIAQTVMSCRSCNVAIVVSVCWMESAVHSFERSRTCAPGAQEEDEHSSLHKVGSVPSLLHHTNHPLFCCI